MSDIIFLGYSKHRLLSYPVGTRTIETKTTQHLSRIAQDGDKSGMKNDGDPYHLHEE